MQDIMRKFFNSLIDAAQVKQANPRLNAIMFYDNLYELVRNMYLDEKGFRNELSEENRKILRQSFLPAFVSVVGQTRVLINNLEGCDLNVARTRLSQMSFLRHEAFNLYKEITDEQQQTSSSQVQQAISQLDTNIDNLGEEVEIWTSPHYDFAEDNPRDVPNLNGVPLSHTWWTEKHREMWLNK